MYDSMNRHMLPNHGCDWTLSTDDPAIEQQMIDKLVRLMAENDSPVEQYERLGLEVDSDQNPRVTPAEGPGSSQFGSRALL